nr:MAG TPA: hypothetical protein [Caudoviricetes sp.]
MADGRRRGGRLLKQKMDAILINGYIIRVNSAVSCFSHMSIAGPSQSADVKAVKDTPRIFSPVVLRLATRIRQYTLPSGPLPVIGYVQTQSTSGKCRVPPLFATRRQGVRCESTAVD